MMIDFQYMSICLFGLRIGKDNENWRLAYGIVSPAIEKMDEPSVSGSTQLGSCEYGKMSIRKVLWSGEREIVLGIYDDLVSGMSLKTTFSRHGVDITKLDFDLGYTQSGFVEPWGTEYVTGCQRAYTKKITMLDPSQLVVKGGKIAKDADKGIGLIETYLKKQTGLPFDERYDHVGNLEIVIVPDRDEAGHPLIELNWEKGKPFYQHIRVHKELLEVSDELIINIVCTENDRTVIDLVDRIAVTKLRDVEKAYPIQNCPDTIHIKIWRQRKDASIVLTETMYCLLKSINVTMGLYGNEMKVSTKWLDDIRQNMPRKKEKDLEVAETFDRSEKQQFTIGEKISNRRLKRKRIKLNDEFFPKGWDAATEEQGMLSFLGWFKKKAKGAKSVFLQDPYFEDVAMYFLASADVSCEYTVLTQTQLKTNPDGTGGKVEEGEERKRKSKIVEGIKQNPRMFEPMKLVVKDLPITHNTLHDRYLVFDYGEGNVEAYTLSNSLQGATNKQPLLVTQIGDFAFEKVSAHIAEVLKKENIDTIYDYSERKPTCAGDFEKVADKGFYSWLEIQKEALKKGDVRPILDDIIEWKTYEKLATLGYFLASTADDEVEDILNQFVKCMETDRKWTSVLKDFILKGHYTEYPIGYIKTPFNAYVYADMTPMLGMKYEEIVTAWNTHLMDYIGCEGHTYGVYGQYFAAKLLLKLSVTEYVDVLKQLSPTLLDIKTDKTIEPCYKLTVMLMKELIEADFWEKSDRVMKTLLSDENTWCRGLGALLMLHSAQDDDFRCKNYRHFITDDDEMVTMCHAAWGMKPATVHQEVFYEWLRETFIKIGDVGYFKNRLIKDVLGETHFMDDKVDYMMNVVKPLSDCGFVNKDDLSLTITNELYEKSVTGEHTVAMVGVLPECLFSLDCDLEPLYERAMKEKDDFEDKMKRIAVKDNDSVFFVAKRCIELRLLLKWLIKKYEKKSSSTIDKLKLLLCEIDKELDSYELEETKNMYESYVTSPKG